LLSGQRHEDRQGLHRRSVLVSALPVFHPSPASQRSPPVRARLGRIPGEASEYRKFAASTEGPLDPRAPRAETDAVGCPWTVAMLSSQLADGPSRVAEHHSRASRYASPHLPSFRLLGRGVFRPLSTARSATVRGRSLLAPRRRR